MEVSVPGSYRLTSRHALLGAFVVSFLSLPACEDISEYEDTPPSAGRDVAPIVDGARERDEPAVVMIYNDRGAACTATVIAPRVVLTAKHCVEGMPNWGWHVYVGADYRSFYDEYGVTDTRTTPGQDVTNSDIAVMILGRDFAHGTKPWAFARQPGFVSGATITAIGYGQTRFNSPNTAGTKYRRDGAVQVVGPNAMWGLGDSEFVTQGENTCQGDSGGPILFNGVVVGVVSRGEEGCTGMGIMTRVSSFTDMINQALEDTGACVPSAVESCNNADDDCDGTVDNGLGPSCGCADGGAPSEESCDQVDNDCNGEVDDLEGCGCSGGGEPAEEICDGIDNDCNGQTDEVCLQLGEACTEDRECAGGLCRDMDGTMMCTAACSAGVPCPDGSYCDGQACGEGLCRPHAGTAAVGQSCTSGGDCVTGLCAPTASGEQVCARQCSPGQLDCFATEVCAEIGTGCGGCVLPEQWEGGIHFGEPCDHDDRCWSGICLIDGDPEACGSGCTYQYCTEPCGDDGSCPPGGHCRDGQCIRGPYSELGHMCNQSGDCAAGTCEAIGEIDRCATSCEAGCEAEFSCIEEAAFCGPNQLLPGDLCNEGQDENCQGHCAFVGGDRLCVSHCDAARQCPAGLSCVPNDDRLSGMCVPADIEVSAPLDHGGSRGCGCVAAPEKGNPAPWLLFALICSVVFCRPFSRWFSGR